MSATIHILPIRNLMPCRRCNGLTFDDGDLTGRAAPVGDCQRPEDRK